MLLVIPMLMILALALTGTQVNASASSIESVVDLKTRINRVTMTALSDLFVASTNHLYKVVDDRGELRVEIDLVTGPKLQKQQCAFITESSSYSAGTQCIKVA